MSDLIVLRILGPAEVLKPGGRVATAVLAQPKRVALLTYLALTDSADFVRRDEILALFWPENGAAQARNALRQALHFLRRHLGAETIRSRGREELGLDLRLVWVDAREFRRRAAVHDWESALDLYRGDLLQGLFVTRASAALDHWLDNTRSRFREAAWTVACEAAEASAGVGDLTRALESAKMATELQPLNERSVRLLMRTLAEAGDRAAAFHVYESFTRTLREECDSEPEPATADLAQEVRGGGTGVSSAALSISPLALPQSLQGPDFEPRAVRNPSQAMRRSPSPERRSPDGRRRWLTVVAAITAAAAGLIWLLTSAGPDVTPNPTGTEVVLSDFAMTSGDEDIAAAVTWALKTDLARSPRVSLVSDFAIDDALRRMESAGPLRPDVAKDLAVRNGYEMVIEGEVAGAGTGWILTVRLVRADSGLVLEAVRENAYDSAGVVPAVDRLSRRLRAALGESNRSIRNLPRLPELTTPSLGALRALAAGWDAYDTGDSSPGDHFRRALAADGDFAAAHAALGVWLHFNAARPREARSHLERAYALRHRLTTGERTDVIWAYHSTISRNHDAAARAVESYLRERPEERPFYQWELILTAMQTGDFARAEVLLLQLRDLQGELNPPMTTNLVGTLLMLGKLDAVEQEFERSPNPRLQLAVALLSEEWTRAEETVLSSAVPPGDEAMVRTVTALARGRVGNARGWAEDWAERVADDDDSGPAVSATILVRFIAHPDLLLRGDTARALLLVDSVAGAVTAMGVSDSSVETRAHPSPLALGSRAGFGLHLWLAEVYALAGRTADARLHLEAFDTAADPVTRDELSWDRAAVEGRIHLAEGRPEEAVRLLRTAKIRGAGRNARCRSCLHAVNGDAFQALNQPDSAIAQYEAFLKTRWLFAADRYDRVLHLGSVRERIATLYRSVGRPERAAEILCSLYEDWRDGDRELQHRMGAAQAELLAISGSSPDLLPPASNPADILDRCAGTSGEVGAIAAG